MYREQKKLSLVRPTLRFSHIKPTAKFIIIHIVAALHKPHHHS